MYSVKVNGKLVAKDKPLPVDYKYLAPVPQVGEYTVVTVTPDDYSGYLDLVDSQC